MANSRSLPVVHRRCGRCTACCTVMRIKELAKAENQPCPHCFESGCRIYATRPQSCRDFQCAWIRGDGSEDDRPDKTGVFFFYRLTPAFGERVLVCKQVWPGAADQPRPRAILAEKARREPVAICREKSYQLVGPEAALLRIHNCIRKVYGKLSGATPAAGTHAAPADLSDISAPNS